LPRNFEQLGDVALVGEFYQGRSEFFGEEILFQIEMDG